MKKIINFVRRTLSYVVYVCSSIIILFFLLLVIPRVCSMLFMAVVGKISPATLYAFFIGAMWSPHILPVTLAWIIVSAWPFFVLIPWVVRDSKKFVAKGITTRPWIWGLGMIFPLILVVFPVYFVVRNLFWKEKLEAPNIDNNLEGANSRGGQKMKQKWRWWAILLVGLITYSLGVNLLQYIGSKNRTIGDFLVNFALSNSCNLGKSDCDEPRAIPKILQNKKIVFNSDISVEFNPLSQTERGFGEVDVLGILNTNPGGPGVDTSYKPDFGKWGYLQDREYKIVRAVYHYNCSYCVDSSSYGYLVVEDPEGNRFELLLDDMDVSTEPARDIPWDEQLPSEIGLKEYFGRLIDIKLGST